MNRSIQRIVRLTRPLWVCKGSCGVPPLASLPSSVSACQAGNINEINSPLSALSGSYFTFASSSTTSSLIPDNIQARSNGKGPIASLASEMLIPHVMTTNEKMHTSSRILDEEIMSSEGKHQTPNDTQRSAAVDSAGSSIPSPPVNGENPPPPWMPTRMLRKRKTLMKRMGHLMQLLEKERELEVLEEKKHPEFNPGDAVELKLVVPENKRRTTYFKGVCIAKRNRGWRSSFTLRNHLPGGGGIERTFPLYSPHILEIKLIRAARRRIRRAKLYYLRDVQPKEYKV